MKKRRLKRPIVYAIYSLGFVMLLGTLYLIDSFFPTNSFNGVDDDYVNKTVIEEDIPVINTSDTIIKPYLVDDVSILKNYYDYKSEAENQEKSLIYYENTYLQNSGVSYGREATFDIVSILDGTVTSIKEDQNLGKIVEVTHSNDIISIYQSLSEVKVKENQEIKQGDIIGTSGTCNIESDLNNHLHFEMIVKGAIVNPENYYDKKISEI